MPLLLKQIFYISFFYINYIARSSLGLQVWARDSFVALCAWFYLLRVHLSSFLMICYYNYSKLYKIGDMSSIFLNFLRLWGINFLYDTRAWKKKLERTTEISLFSANYILSSYKSFTENQWNSTNESVK